ncbi:protein kinase [Haloechinothrix sp. LS1_15]|nr:protein kinase [Haloechinothrix sp. LS1_15]
MGVVWRGYDQVIGREVAIKEIRLPEDDGGAVAARVLREVRSGGRLSDPTVVTVFDVVTQGETTFIVMELVEAPTLAQLVAARGPLPPAEVAAIGEQVLSALRAAHDAGIVHRDVKPGNIMVGAAGRVKLTDFGIAQAVDDPRLTTSGTLVGSPAFMAPERVSGREAVPASDLWALGASLFFAAEGVVPFERDSTAATLHAIVSEVPYLTRVQGPLASVIMGLLAPDPRGRISAEQARRLLVLTGSGAGQLGAPPPQAVGGRQQPPNTMAVTARSTGPAARPRLRWRLATAGGAVAAVGLLAAGTAFGHWVGSPTEDEAQLPTLTRGSEDDADIAFGFDGARDGICGVGQIEPGRRVTGTNQVDCDEPHDYEVFDVVRSVASSDSLASLGADGIHPEYPGEEALAEYAEQRCKLAFESDAIVAEYQERPKQEVLSYRALIPTEERWTRTDEDGEPRKLYHVTCVVTHRDGDQLEGRVSRYLE